MKKLYRNQIIIIIINIKIIIMMKSILLNHSFYGKWGILIIEHSTNVVGHWMQSLPISQSEDFFPLWFRSAVSGKCLLLVHN